MIPDGSRCLVDGRWSLASEPTREQTTEGLLDEGLSRVGEVTVHGMTLRGICIVHRLSLGGHVPHATTGGRRPWSVS